VARMKLLALSLALPTLVLFRGAAPPAQAQRLESTFTPLTPCRVVDSRIGRGTQGPLTPGVVHPIAFSGRCGIPTRSVLGGGIDVNEATAVALNIVAVAPAGFGHLVAWPSNQGMPETAIINYSPGQTVANGVTVPMCQEDCPAGDISFVAGVSAVHLVVDVMGYYSKPVEPDSWRHGAGPGIENFLCVNNTAGVRFGLSSRFGHKSEAERLCPAGTWLCTAGQVGTTGCDTSREDSNCDGRSCPGACLDDPADNHRGWTSSLNFGALNSYITVNEAGVLAGSSVCEMRPAWCCSPND
jgi:hypothetical protein